MQTTLKGAVVALTVMFMVGCGGDSSAPQATGGMKFSVKAQAASVATSATLTITGPEDYTKTWDAPPFTFNESPCLVGHYTYTVTATGTGGATFSGAGAFDIMPGDVTQVIALLQQDNAVATEIVAPYTEQVKFVLPGQDGHSGGWKVPLDITALVTHPNGNNPDLAFFGYIWKHSCNGLAPSEKGFSPPVAVFMQGTSEPTAEVSTKFTSECQGTEVITLTTINTNGRFCSGEACLIESSVSFEIPYDPQGFTGEIDVNFAPTVKCGIVANAEPLPGDPVYIKAGYADPDKDPMKSAAWTDDCGGSFSDATILDPVWTAPAEKFCQVCTLKLTVVDERGGTNMGTIQLKTAPADLTQGCVVPN